MTEPTSTPQYGAAETEWLPVLDIDPPLKQSRLAVFFRMLLVIPHLIVLWVLGIIAFFVTVFGWFAALFMGRLPDAVAHYLTSYLGYSTRVSGYLMLTVDKYPPFGFRTQDYPVRIEVRPGPLNRLAVLFRIFLMIPAMIVQTIVEYGWWAASFVIWLIVLFSGRMPKTLFDATAAIMRYTMRFDAYATMLTSAYPKRLFGDAGREEAPASATRPLILSSAARALLVVFIIVGIAASVTASAARNSNSDGQYSAVPASRTVDRLGWSSYLSR